MFAKCEPFELVQAVAFSSAIDHRILEQQLSGTGMVHSRLRATIASNVFQLPSIPPLVVQQARVVVAFVEVFEDGGKDLGDFFGEVDSLGCGLEELTAADGGEEGGGGEDVFVCGEEAL